MKQRNRKALEQAIERAGSVKERALAYYNLGVFHDNNSREAEAIPNYVEALKLGLDNNAMRAMALTWLASSLYKTGKPKEGMARALEAEALCDDPKLGEFVKGLKRRIAKKLQ